MDFVHNQWQQDTSFACLRSSISCRGSHRRWRHGSPSAAPTSLRCWKRACKEAGFPATIRLDQGSEFVSRDLDMWAYQRVVTLDFSRPGKPTDTDVVDKPHVAKALLCRDRGFARHRVYSFSASRPRSSALFGGML